MSSTKKIVLGIVQEARMPLHGHPYHKKSDAELQYIQKDAGEAARANKGRPAEGKYLDQMNDASTVLYHRSKGGKRVTEDTISELKTSTIQSYSDKKAENPIAPHLKQTGTKGPWRHDVVTMVGKKPLNVSVANKGRAIHRLTKDKLDTIFKNIGKKKLDEVNNQQLFNYLKAQGYNPQTMTTADMLNKARTGNFKQWKQNHEFSANKEVDAKRNDYKKRVSEENINEISVDTVKSYLDKSKAAKSPETFKKLNVRLTSRDRAHDRVHKDELKKIGDKFTDSLKEELNTEATGMLMKFIQAKGINPLTMDGNAKKLYSDSSEFKHFKHKHRSKVKAVKEEIQRQTKLYGADNMIEVVVNRQLPEAAPAYDVEKTDKPAAGMTKPSTNTKNTIARILVKGGTTMTGKPRDVVQIDPLLKVRPGQWQGANQGDNLGNKIATKGSGSPY